MTASPDARFLAHDGALQPLLRVARTIADLANSNPITAEQMSQAIQYRVLERMR